MLHFGVISYYFQIDIPYLILLLNTQREMYSRDKISIRNYNELSKLGFNFEVSQPEECERGERNEDEEREHQEDATPTLKKSLFSSDVLKNPSFKRRNEEYEATWNTQYNALIGKYVFIEEFAIWIYGIFPNISRIE